MLVQISAPIDLQLPRNTLGGSADGTLLIARDGPCVTALRALLSLIHDVGECVLQIRLWGRREGRRAVITDVLVFGNNNNDNPSDITDVVVLAGILECDAPTTPTPGGKALSRYIALEDVMRRLRGHISEAET